MTYSSKKLNCESFGVENQTDFLKVVDEKIDITRCHGKQNCQKDQRCLTHDLWMELNMHVSGFLNGITISDLINRNNVRHVSKQQDFAYVQMHRS